MPDAGSEGEESGRESGVDPVEGFAELFKGESARGRARAPAGPAP
ncbi:MAG: hypothetical protein JWP57_3984 [Spirosoma sp.]|nr:hypothetical protein [Spirosoma sp.]